MTAGRPVGDVNDEALAPAAGHRRGARAPAGAPDGDLRAGPVALRRALRARRASGPAPLRDLPALPGDELDRARSGGDLCVQACADDPQVAFHAVRNLARIGRGAVTVRWSQLGFGRTSSTSRAQATPRNLMGFKDGTANLKAEDVDALARHVWVAGDRRSEPAWLRDGTYLVARRIRMLIEVWDRTSLGDQEQTIGRHKASGAPLGGRDEFATLEASSAAARRQPTSASPRRRPTAAPRSCGAATRSPTASTTASASSTPGSSSSSFQRDPEAFVACPAPARLRRRAQRVHQARRLGRVGRSRPASGVAATSVRGSSPRSRQAAGLGARARPAGAPPSRRAAGLGARARPAGAGRARGRRRPRGEPPRHVTARRRRREGRGRGCAPPRGAS